MSMGLILKTVRDHLRAAVPLAVEQCAIVAGGVPPASAGELFVAIDELKVESVAREHLHETFEIEVAVWRRAGQYPPDRAGDLQLDDDPYLSQLATLDGLERVVIRLLHGNYRQIVAPANAALLGEDDISRGDIFQLALHYQGRDRCERYPPGKAGGGSTEWLGRRMRFRGMTRVQSLDVMR